MKTIKLLKPFSPLLIFLFLAPLTLGAQCQLIYEGSLCLKSPVRFYGAKAGTSHKMIFNGEDSISGLINVTYTFKTPGLKKITYITKINGTPCTSSVNLTILTLPVLKTRLTTTHTQCFEQNLFCFRDSFYNTNKAAITWVSSEISDGQLFEFKTVKMPSDFCISIKDPRGGSFWRLMSVQDANGCISRDTFYNIYVHEKLGPRFTRSSLKNPGCDSVIAEITNISNIAQSKVKTSVWRWSDGTTSANWGPKFKKTFTRLVRD
jgi:hypothetical protein